MIGLVDEYYLAKNGWFKIVVFFKNKHNVHMQLTFVSPQSGIVVFFFPDCPFKLPQCFNFFFFLVYLRPYFGS